MELYTFDSKKELLKIVEKDGDYHTYKLLNIKILPSSEIEFNWQPEPDAIATPAMFLLFKKKEHYSLSPYTYLDAIISQLKSMEEARDRHELYKLLPELK